MVRSLKIRDQVFDWGSRTYVMGVLNVTPDSFSDGGRFNTIETAIAQAKSMIEAGVDIIDIGGQSTRPGSNLISLEEELRRVIPVVEALRTQGGEFAKIPISVDTTVSMVAKAAVKAGADLVNDISGAAFDPQMIATVAALGIPIVLMHLRGTPKTMQTLTQYQDLIGEISQFLQSRIQACQMAGINLDQIILDPGIGFAKTYEQNLEILRRLPELNVLHCPILIGPSRKSFIGHILNQPNPQARDWGTAAACVSAIAGSADIVRVHDVKAMVEVCQVADAIYRTRFTGQMSRG
ncbi:MAG: dihydropteroate synthase [Microcoleaceae cyanobacterium]